MTTMFTSPFGNNNLKYIIIFILCFFPANSFAEKNEYAITSGQIDLILATNQIIFDHHDEESHFKLTKEYSYNQLSLSKDGAAFKYVAEYVYNTRDYPLYYCVELPEIGDWSVVKYSHGDVSTDKPPIAHLSCKLYTNNDIIKYDFSLWPQDHVIISPNGNRYHAYPWAMSHFGNRPSIENPCQVRFNKELLFERNNSDTKLKILLVKDLQSDYSQRIEQRYDDIYIIYYTGYAKKTMDIMSYIIPRIFFIKLEKNFIRAKYPDWHYDLYFTIIVQLPLSPNGKTWEFHRLEVLKKSGQAPYITINDLGPIPRSEWEPDWPDPATTPLWVKETAD